jgi:cytochrome c553
MMSGDGDAVEQAVEQAMEQAVEQEVALAFDEGRALTADEVKFFESKIRPLLITHCYGCHSKSANASKGGLRLDTRDATLRGGKSGPAVVPGDLDSSLLVRAVRYHDVDFQMPPDGKISDDEIALLERWVEMGAPDPRVDKPAAAGGASPGTDHRWTAEDIARGRANHWAYQPVAAHTPPAVADAAWSATAIDAFLMAAMAERGLTPADLADKRTLLRRASFDLTGLPPSEADLAAFERDASPDAFAKAVDRLLASSAYGERWGRHWLDVARYAESSGKESNLLYPHAWRYRDYVIDAFNEDKPYDRFLVEQLAGDLLPAASDADRAEHLVATGYLAFGTKSHNARGKPQFQMDLADEQLDAATQGMLGLTVACARCHDHKFDPITQKDYYAVAGIFLSTDTRFGTFEGQQNNHASALIELPRESGMPAGPTMRPEQRSILASLKTRTEEEAERAAAVIAQAREARQAGKELPANIQQQIVRARATQGAVRNLESMTSRFDERGEPTEANMVAMGAVDRDRALNARVLDRGELDKPGEVVHRGFVQLLSTGSEQKINKGSGRLALAEWIARDDNPLTARVWANRVWLHLFGQPLVPTPDNFGMSGLAPSHPELLDHLAARLVASGWSTKALIREIMLTRAYAMSSAFDAKNAEIDPDGTYLWRMPKKRLEAEAIRDAMLAAAGVLDAKPRVGSPVAFLEGGLRGPGIERLAGTLNGVGDNHRSVYLPIVRDRVPESLEVFDFAEPAFVTGKRDATNVPTQALFLMNSEEITRLADRFAARVIDAGERDVDRIRAAFAIAFGRAPSSAEIAACRDFLGDFRKAAAKEPAARNDAPAQAGGQRPRDAMRQRVMDRLNQRRGAAPGGPNQVSGDMLAYSALCQALFLSGEFRTID